MEKFTNFANKKINQNGNHTHSQNHPEIFRPGS